MKALITGITGFAGSHLAELLLDEGHEVAGASRLRSPMQNLSREVTDRVKLIECELKDSTAVKKMLADMRPDWIFHLAAQSFVPTSWISPGDTLNNNIQSQVNIFESMRELDLDETRVVIAGSSEAYGLVYENEIPITEENPLRPLSPYAVSKVAQDLLGFQYHRSYGLNIVRARAFNHTGPRRGEIFVSSNFAQQIARIEAGLQEPVIRVGNLEARRDFTDVRDTVRAYLALIQGGEPGDVYNICSGEAVRIQEVLEKLLSLTERDIKVEVDRGRMRPSDVPVLLGDCKKLKEKVGWERKITFDRTLEDLLDYWREKS